MVGHWRGVAVNEIDMRSVLDPGKQRMRALSLRYQPVLAHMGHCQTGRRIKGATGATNQTKKRCVALLRALE